MSVSSGMDDSFEEDVPEPTMSQEDLEEFQNLMPDQSPGVAMQILYVVVSIVFFAILFSPVIAYVVVGFEAAIVMFLTAFLVLLFQMF